MARGRAGPGGWSIAARLGEYCVHQQPGKSHTARDVPDLNLVRGSSRTRKTLSETRSRPLPCWIDDYPGPASSTVSR